MPRTLRRDWSPLLFAGLSKALRGAVGNSLVVTTASPQVSSKNSETGSYAQEPEDEAVRDARGVAVSA